MLFRSSWCPDHNPMWIAVGGRTLGHLVEVPSEFGLSAAGILLYLEFNFEYMLYMIVNHQGDAGLRV